MIPPFILSSAASFVIFTSTFPQMRQTLKTRLTRDLSLLNLIQCVSGLALWTLYAIETGQWIFAIGDGIDMSMWAVVLAQKIINVVKGRELPQEEMTIWKMVN